MCFPKPINLTKKKERDAYTKELGRYLNEIKKFKEEYKKTGIIYAHPALI